jgi:DNA-binding transcriptional MerR regulator
MSTYRITEAAQLVGVPATTLRYYEDIGLVARPARGGNGYRSYDDRDLARLRFLARAKALNLSLEHLRELVQAWERDDCATVQDRLAGVLTERLAQTRAQIADLTDLADQLQRVADRLQPAETVGPCSPRCPCGSPPETVEVVSPGVRRPLIR